MKNPFKYLQQDLIIRNEDYKKLVMKTYMIVLGLIFTAGLPYLIKGIFFALLGRKSKQYRAFTHGSKIWGNKVIEYTETSLYYSNEIQVPETGHMIFLNHVNELDFPFDCCVINKPYLANQAIKSSIFAYWWMKAMGSQVFDTSHQRTIAISVHNLVAGLKDYSYIVYPEGHNTYSEEIKPLKKGMIKVAFENKIPIYVIVKSGVQALQFKPKGNKIGYRACGTFYPENYSSWEELRESIYETMVSEKKILDKEIQISSLS